MEINKKGVHIYLKENSDYYVKEEVSKKPILSKMGAEKFIEALPNTIVLYSLHSSSPTSYIVNATIQQNGNILGNSYGASEISEWDNDINTTIKMAQKRALVGAVINVFLLSDIFTQDLEDKKHTTKQQNTQPSPTIKSNYFLSAEKRIKEADIKELPLVEKKMRQWDKLTEEEKDELSFIIQLRLL